MDKNKLAAMLANSKKLMNVVDSGNYNRGNIDPNMLEEKGIREAYTGGQMESQQSSAAKPMTNYSSDMVKNSRLPDHIKNLMIEQPINVPENPFSFDFDEELIQQVNSMAPSTQRQPIKEETRYTQTMKSKTNVPNEDIRSMIAEEIAKALPSIIDEYFDKRLIKENVQFKVGNTLMSGNMSPLPKTQTKRRNG